MTLTGWPSLELTELSCKIILNFRKPHVLISVFLFPFQKTNLTNVKFVAEPSENTAPSLSIIECTAARSHTAVQNARRTSQYPGTYDVTSSYTRANGLTYVQIVCGHLTTPVTWPDIGGNYIIQTPRSRQKIEQYIFEQLKGSRKTFGKSSVKNRYWYNGSENSRWGIGKRRKIGNEIGNNRKIVVKSLETKNRKQLEE
jgi:hypothetical protein